MKKECDQVIPKNRLFVYLSVMIALLWNSPSFAGDTVRITTGEFPPYVSENLKHQGLVTRIVREAFRLVDMEAQFKFFPWKRSKNLVKIGAWDACSFWAKMPSIEKNFHVSDTLVEGPLVFFHSRKTDFDWQNVEDLQEYRIGGVLGNVYGPAIASAEKAGKIDIYRLPGEKEAMKLLVNGGIEIFPVNREAGFYLLHKNFPGKKLREITYHPKPIRISDYALIFSKKPEKSKKLVERFNTGLKKLKESGRYEKYLKESREGAYIIPK